MNYALIPMPESKKEAWKNLSGSEVKVYVCLSFHYNANERNCWPSLATISNSTGIDRKNVGKLINNLCLKGYVVRHKIKNFKGSYDQNLYYLPDRVSFELEQLMNDKKNQKNNKKLIAELKDLNNKLLLEINTLALGAINNMAGAINITAGAIKKSSGVIKTGVGVPSTGPTNNTNINTTINIIKNVAKNNEDLTSRFTQQKNHKRSLSIRGSSQHIGEIGALIRIKHEGLVQEIAAALNDQKSIPFYRKLVSKFADHEESIYKCLSLTRETDEISGINKSRGAVFTDHVKREAIQLGIKL